jgi:hypothetical protein
MAERGGAMTHPPPKLLDQLRNALLEHKEVKTTGTCACAHNRGGPLSWSNVT